MNMMQMILPVIFLMAGLLAGIIGEILIFNKIKKIVFRKKLLGGEIIFRSLNRMTFIWFTIAGCFGAILSYPLDNNIAEALKKLTTIVFLYSVTLVFARLTAGFVNLFLQRTEGLSASLFSNITKTAVLVFGILIILQTVGIEVTPLITTLGIGGLAVGLALQDTLANLFSGVYLILSNQVKTGDYIKLDGGYEGYVTDITWRNTTIKELSNNVVIVPNSKLGTAIFTNYHLPAKEISLTMKVGVSYDSDLDKVERVTVEVAKEVMQEVAPNLLRNHIFAFILLVILV